MSELSERLRRAFDGAFAKEADLVEGDRESVMLFHAGEARIAVRVADASEAIQRTRWTHVVSDDSALLGLTSVRGRLVAVYDVLALLGRDAGASSGDWIVLASGDRSFGARFGSYAGLIQVSRAEIRRGADTTAGEAEWIRVEAVRFDLIRMQELIATRSNSGAVEAARED